MLPAVVVEIPGINMIFTKTAHLMKILPHLAHKAIIKRLQLAQIL